MLNYFNRVTSFLTGQQMQDAVFGVIPGVKRTRVGYSGGTTEGPTYSNIGDHSETLQVDYDPNEVTYDELLEVFWNNHNPVPKRSRQYMSAIFTHDEEQMKKALQSKEAYESKKGVTVATEIKAAGDFYLAEDYHQKYLLSNKRALRPAVPETTAKGLADSFVAARLNGFCGKKGSMALLQKEISLYNLNEKQKEVLMGLVNKSTL